MLLLLRRLHSSASSSSSSLRPLLARRGRTTAGGARSSALLAPHTTDLRGRTRTLATLVISEPLEGTDGTTKSPPAATCAAVAAAQQLNNPPIQLLVVGPHAPSHVPQGVDQIVHAAVVDAPATAETVAAAIAAAVQGDDRVTCVVGASTKFGATAVPRAAALLGISPVTDVVQILGSESFVRPMYAGNALAHVQKSSTAASKPLQVLTIRPTAFDKAPLQPVDNNLPIQSLSIEPYPHTSVVASSSSSSSSETKSEDAPSLVELGAARVVVSGGRGMKDGSNFAMLQQLASKLDPRASSVGASRAAVDAGMVPNDWQVGQTGKVVAPELYLAIGISGAIQHLSGMRDSKTIVAINADKDAPIFQVADYGLVADLFQAVPELIEKL